MPRIFISYRRDDSAGHAGRLYDRLKEHFGPEQIFMDIDTIKPGLDFVEAVQQAVGSCDGLVAIIGREWQEVADATGQRRLDDPADMVRVEIATALERGIRVIPVLVQGAQTPADKDLPDALKRLARQNALELSDTRFHSDVDRLVEALQAPIPDISTPLPEPRFLQPLVGRDRELALLRNQVDAASRGEGSLVFITGEAGVGKTRLAWEVRSYARSRGFLWLEGHYLNEGNMPYQAWVEAVRGFLRSAPPEMVEKVLLPYGAELARLVPEVAERLGQVPSLASIGPEEERLRLFEALAGFFCAIAREQPLVLFLDDLQWAASVDTLHHLVRNLTVDRVLVLGTYRDVELMEQAALTRTFLAMNRERLFQAMPLKRLQEAEVSRMLAQTLGEEPSERLAQVVYEKTEGNPFFVEEVTRYLIESGAVTQGETGWELRETAMMELPVSVKAVVGEKLERLGEESHGVLTWAAVAGQEFTLQLLQEVAGLEEEELLEVIDKAEEARVLVPRSSRGQEVYAFADNQTREVLYEGIRTARRRRYHLRVGQAMETVHARRLEEHYDALAHHFLEGNDLQKAADYALRAGDRAAGVYTWERAITQYQTSLELLEELDADALRQAEVLEKLALVIGLGRGRDAVGYWEKALSIYETLGDGKKAGSVHLRLGTPYGQGVITTDRQKVYSHCLKALALLEPEGEIPQLALAYGHLGWMAAHGYGPRTDAVPLLLKGLDLAERLGDATGVIDIARLLGHVLVYHTGEISRGLKLYQRCCDEARQAGNFVAFSQAAIELSREYNYLRDTGSGLHWAEQGREASQHAGTLPSQLLSNLALAWAQILRGDAAGSISSLETALQTARKGGIESTRFLGAFNVVPCRVHVFLGDWDQASTELVELRESAEQLHNPTVSPLWFAPVQGWLCLEGDDLVEAKANFMEAVGFCQSVGDNPPELYARALLVQVCSKRDELEEAESHLHRAKEIFSLSPDWLGLAAEVHLAEGILAAAQQRWEAAEGAFQKAVEVNRQYHLPYYEARSLLEWGEMYLSRDDSSDREQGMQLLDQALAIFQGVQAKKMVEKVLARKQVIQT